MSSSLGVAKRQRLETTEQAVTPASVKPVVSQKVQGGHTFTFKSFKQVPSENTARPAVLAPLMTHNNSQPSKEARHNNSQSSKDARPAPAELCKGHKAPCTKKTVSKEGPNKLRLFWSCSLPKAKSC